MCCFVCLGAWVLCALVLLVFFHARSHFRGFRIPSLPPCVVRAPAHNARRTKAGGERSSDSLLEIFRLSPVTCSRFLCNCSSTDDLGTDSSSLYVLVFGLNSYCKLSLLQADIQPTCIVVVLAEQSYSQSFEHHDLHCPGQRREWSRFRRRRSVHHY